MSWHKKLLALHEESAGLMKLYVLTPANAIKVVAASLAGDREAIDVSQLTLRFLEKIGGEKPEHPTLCMCCPAPLHGTKFVIRVVLPHRDTPTQGIALAICGRCASEPKQFRAKAIEGLRLHWPDLHEVTITHPNGGHA